MDIFSCTYCGFCDYNIYYAKSDPLEASAIFQVMTRKTIIGIISATVGSLLSVKAKCRNRIRWRPLHGARSGRYYDPLHCEQIISHSQRFTANTTAPDEFVRFSAAAPYADVRIAEYSGGDTLADSSRASGSSTNRSSGSVNNSTAILLVSAVTTAGAVPALGPGFNSRVITSPDGILTLVSAKSFDMEVKNEKSSAPNSMFIACN